MRTKATNVVLRSGQSFLSRHLDHQSAATARLLSAVWGYEPWFAHFGRHYAWITNDRAFLCRYKGRVGKQQAVQCDLQAVPALRIAYEAATAVSLNSDALTAMDVLGNKGDEKPALWEVKHNAFEVWQRQAKPVYLARRFMPYGPQAAAARDLGKKFYNIFTGWACKPAAEPEPAPMFTGFLLDIICNGNVELYEFLLRWLRQVYQHPEEPTQLCLVFYSQARGTGKSFALDKIGELFEPYSCVLNDSQVGRSLQWPSRV